MSKIYVGEISGANLKQIDEIIQKIIIANYVKGDASSASKKIIKLFVVRENTQKIFKK